MLVWVRGSNGWVPEGSVVAGHDKVAGTLYAGRAFHQNDCLPARVSPHNGVAYVGYGGLEHKVPDYEVLWNSKVAWSSAENGEVPPEAVIFGTTVEGENLYMGRVFHDGNLIPGKIHPSHGVCYIPYEGREETFQKYEVMIEFNIKD